MLNIDCGIDIEVLDQLQESIQVEEAIVDLLHQDPVTNDWTTTSLPESEAFSFQRRLDSLGLDYLPVV